jgi:hypothetical protein
MLCGHGEGVAAVWVGAGLMESSVASLPVQQWKLDFRCEIIWGTYGFQIKYDVGL